MRLAVLFFGFSMFSALPATALADDARMRADVHEYYAGETTTGTLFTAFGGVSAAAGGAMLTQGGDFAKGLGLSTLVLGGVTFVGGLGYVLAVKLRGGYFERLAETDPARFQEEESERLAGTKSRFWLYLGSELAVAAAGVGVAAYGIAAKDPLAKGIGIGGALQGIGWFVIDTPGKLRAARYADEVGGFRANETPSPRLGASIGGGTRPWSLTLTQVF